MRSLCQEGFERWIKFLKKDLDEAKAKYKPKAKFETKGLAEYLISIIEGSGILAKAKKDKRIVERNLLYFKDYMENLIRG